MPNKRKRSTEHLLKKIRKLEKKILQNCTDSDEAVEENQQLEPEREESGSMLEENILEIEETLEDEKENKENEDTENEPTLEGEVLEILGAAPAPELKKDNLHKEIAERWTEILKKGLKKEEKEEISKENPPFINVDNMITPKLNKEVAAALNESQRKRDAIIESRQKQLSTTLACVGEALQMALLSDIQENKLKIIKKLNDAGRLLCDSLYLDSKGRKNLILSVINKDLKDYLSETTPAEFLFGENLSEKIKTAKAVQKSGKDLKVDDKSKKQVKQGDKNVAGNKTLNWRGPPRGGAQQRSQRSGPSHRQQPYQKKETASRRGRK